MRHLMPGRVRVAIDRDDLDAQALQSDDHLLTELAASEQHDAGSRSTEGRADSHVVPYCGPPNASNPFAATTKRPRRFPDVGVGEGGTGTGWLKVTSAGAGMRTAASTTAWLI